ncbi:ABC transporter substrate-binding protein [Amycolatopsis thermophila]|uniref:Branched-chain amino acid transport system substrate-binding protein n=1 Tax=Amycolatopsis thermophila TaxID=206084 RepID=A0ABU0F193_9PSEU|nr:ABC transporter substrate-binding protein [Amycolatopsis thermophila]MDQ0381349.1 branched-chain amino acid transport system substrate-binding protein [Amycolatopsis thermophila]
MRRLRSSVLVATAFLLAACANSGGGSAPSTNADAGSGPIKIGVIVPLSGPAGPNGKDVLDAITTKADLINKAGGVRGRQLEVVSQDDKSDPATGVSAANTLINDGAAVVMGGWNSPVTLAIQPVLVRAGVLNITSIPQNASILGGADPDAVRMNAGNAAGAYAAASYLTGDLKAKRVAMLLENDAYGNDAGNYLGKELQAKGVDVVSQQKFALSDTDFRVPLSNVAQSAPDAVFSADAAESSGMPALASQYVDSGIKAPHFAALGTVSPNVVKLAGGAKVDGLLSADLYFPQEAPFATIPANVEFVQAFQARTGQLPDKYAALGAESVDVWAKAVTKAGTTDRDKVAAAIHGQTFTGTVLGDVAFTGKGQLKSHVFAFTVKDGKVSVLGEIPVPDSVWEQ